MSYIIMSGPALAITASSLKYLALLNTAPKRSLVASVEIDVQGKALRLALNSPLTADADLDALLSFLIAVVNQYKGQSIIVRDEDALTLAMAMGAKVTSTDPVIVSAWTTLNFTIEATSGTTTPSGRTPKMRFTGTNIANIKALSSATSVTFTISAK